MSTALTFAALVFLQPVTMSESEVCVGLAGIAASGAQDGLAMSSIPDGIIETITAAEAATEDQVRAVSSVYLSGYAMGLMGETSSDAALRFMAGCMGEGV